MSEMPEGMTADTMCVVTMDGKPIASDDFVAVLSRANGDATLLFQTDALTLGLSLQLITKAFTEALGRCSESERKDINDILCGNIEPEGEMDNGQD
jgi:hypothetical protein